MGMMRFLYIFVLLLVVVGCNPVAKLAVVEASVPTLEGLSMVHGRAVVENDGRRTFTIREATLTVRYRDRELGRGRLVQPIEIAPGETEVTYDMVLEGVTMASVSILASRMMTNPDAITVDIEGRIGPPGRSKKIALRGVELSRLMSIFL